MAHLGGAVDDELYDLSTDPGEEHALIEPDTHTRLTELLESWMAEIPAGARRLRAQVDPGTARELEALGYVGGE